MKCEEVQQILLVEENHSEAKKHLENCVKCQEFTRSLGLIIKAPEEFTVPQALDAKILNFAKNNRPARSESKPIIPFAFVTVAAVIALLLSVSLLNNKSMTDNAPETADNQEVVNPLEPIKPKGMVTEANTEDIDSIINDLWLDDEMDADFMAIESELFVLSAELYSN